MRPVMRPEGVLPQPVSLFMRRGDADADQPAGTLTARISSRSPAADLVSLLAAPGGVAAVSAEPLIAFLPAPPMRRALIAAPIPYWEARTERGLAVSPDTAALAQLFFASSRADSGPAVVAVVLASATLRPAPRPDDFAPLPAAAPVGGNDFGPEISASTVAIAFRPAERPASIAVAAAASARQSEVARSTLARGAVCGSIDIQGTAQGNVDGPGACGIDNAVEVRAVAGVRLSSPAVVDCTTATALRDWVTDVAIPQVGNNGGGLASLQIMGAYSCRTRNNASGERLSEHAFGRAIDIGGFELQNGSRISVLNGWNGSGGEILHAVHDAACGIFGTVLGPAANAAHRNHFHFDTATYRSGSYCR